MAHAPSSEISTPQAPHGRPAVQGPPVSPGKVAMWLFLATEVMFFTGLIGSYIVLRGGSPPTSYSNLFSPATDLKGLENSKGVHITSVGPNHKKVLEIFRRVTNASRLPTESLSWEQCEELLESGHALTGGMPAEKAEALVNELEKAGAVVGHEGPDGKKVKLVPLVTHSWPLPYDHTTNPLSIDLTALNTFFLICSSVTMVLALSAVQRGDQKKFVLFLLATVLIGSLFVGIQFIEYRKLMFADAHPIGISHNGHFRPDSSLFGSCFFTMTGFHGAHVTGGVILLACILIQAIRGKYTPTNHSSVELAGLYWHFVDLVWIILFTVVYLI
ncbi:MAG: heme/copper-type cytochrome/quinol oxidase, subunit 3 [Planctomycetota bacterium]|nr:heme/copper-type cytochrome/quinol oxidase, subunit 3 [Planctomycetota bacterium]